jgi:hypothetical protein
VAFLDAQFELIAELTAGVNRPTRKNGLVEKPPLSCYNGAEDGIRTCGPQIGKVFEIVWGVQANPLAAPRPQNVQPIRLNSMS